VCRGETRPLDLPGTGLPRSWPRRRRQGTTLPRVIRPQHAPESHGGGDDHQAGEHEVRRLDPPGRCIREKAEWVPREVEAIPEDGLNQADREIERARQDDSRHKQGAREQNALIRPWRGLR
jgi:hypothetical protein